MAGEAAGAGGGSLLDPGAGAGAGAAAGAGAGAGTGPAAPDALHDAAYTAFEAWQAAPDKVELKEAAVKAVGAAKAGSKTWAEHQAAQKAAADKAALANKPPEKYEFKFPEKPVLGAKQVERIAAVAKEQGLTTEKAQALYDLHHEAVSAFAAEQTAAVKAKNEGEWLGVLKADKDVGGDKLTESGQLAYRAAEQWFGADFLGLIKEMGVNNHPALFKGLVKIAKASQDDKLIHGGGSGSAETVAQQLFPLSLAAAAKK